MKKAILLFSSVLLSSGFINAQDVMDASVPLDSKGIKEQKLRFGAYVAPTLSWMKPANSKSNDGVYNVSNNGSKIGFTWGLLVDYWFADNYALATGLQVNSTGGQIRATRINDQSVGTAVYNADFKYALQYLELPINLKLKTSPMGKGVYFFGQAGITAGMNIGKKATYTVTSTDNSVSSEEKVKIAGTLSIAPLTIQLNIGAGAQYPFSDRLTAYAGLFFNNGFAPDATNPAKYNFPYSATMGSFSDGNIRLNNLALRLGLYF